jgi:hypothetical protein
MSARRVLVALVLLCGARAPVARAQEFAALPVVAESAAGLLERALPPDGPGARFESSVTSWFGMSELATSAVSLAGGWRGARVSAGVARTGTTEVGWNTLAVAGGWTDRHSGAAVRAALRGQTGEGSWRGVEAGAGAWVQAAPDVRLWCSAPQLWQDGEPPPLTRRLELGARLTAGELELWLLRAAAPGSPGALRGEHAAGVATRLGALVLWTQVRDAPVRGGFGFAATWRGLRVSCEADTHPILGDTLVLGLAAGEGGVDGGAP